MVYGDKNMTVDHGMTMNYEKGIPKACVAAIMFQGMIRLGTPFSRHPSSFYSISRRLGLQIIIIR